MLFYYNLTFTCAKAPHYELLKKIVLSILPGVLNKFYCENVIVSDFIQYLIFIDYFSMIYISFKFGCVPFDPNVQILLAVCEISKLKSQLGECCS